MDFCLPIIINLIFCFSAYSFDNKFLDHLVRHYVDNEYHGNESAQNFITISLGYNCNPAIAARQYDIRTSAFPFDWCLTPYRAVYNFIHSNFKDFFKLEYLVPSSKNNFTPHVVKFLNKTNQIGNSRCTRWVLDKQSGMIFNHDFSDNDLNTIKSHYEESNDKYKRRISRFSNQMNSDKHIYFIRYNDISKNKAIKLLKLIENKFPKTNFTLIVINSKPEFKGNWNIPHLKNYYINLDSDWEKICLDIKSGILRN